MKSLIIGIGALALSFQLSAQMEELNGGPVNVPTEGIVDGVFIQEHIPTKRLISYEYVREADVIYSKRVWQYIDLREKINLPLYYPLDDIGSTGWVKNTSRWSLWTVIRHHVLKGDLKIFSPYDPASFGLGALDGDQLKYPVEPSQPGLNFYTDSLYRDKLVYFFGRLGAQSDVPLTDENGDPIIITLPDGSQGYKYAPQDTIWYTSKDIIQYKIKEDWFFDKERSVLDQRIIALAPVVYKVSEDATTGKKTITGTQDLFWLYFPHCRFVFNNYFVYNDANDAQWMSFDDLFWKRKFSCVIYKESNTYDRFIDSYRIGVDALMESERIKEEIRNIEHDVWSY
jgi:gliding motility associated protien GldN